MKARWKILIGLGIFFVLAMFSAWVAAHHQPQNEVDAYKEFLRSLGEKLEIAEVTPPLVPQSENCADAVKMAFNSFGSASIMLPNIMPMIAPGKALASWRQPDVRSFDGLQSTTNSWDELAVEVAIQRPAVEMLKEVFKRPKLDFAPDYKKGLYVPLPHLASLKRSAQALEAAAILDLHDGDAGTATENLCTILALVRANHDEPLAISHLVRIAMVTIAVSPTWELLQTTNVNDAQLVRLQSAWEQMEFIDSNEKACEMERAFMKGTVEKARLDSAELDRLLGLSGGGGSSSGSFIWSWPPDFDELGNDLRYKAGKALWRASWSYTEEQHLMQAGQIMLEALRTMKTNSQFLKPQFDTMQSKLSSLGLTNAGAEIFRTLKIPDFGDIFSNGWLTPTISKTIRIETARRVVVTAIALKRFQIKHGKWPQSRNELVPDFFSSVPIDPYDGKPLKYHANADGSYLLYSVAENGTDDGGSPTLPAVSKGMYWQHQKASDWVWPQPATAKEIQSYYEEEAAKAAAEFPATSLPVPPPPMPAGTN